MKRVISIVLLAALTFQCFSEFTTLIGFEMHHAYIAEHLCVNQDKPEMDCNGQCYLEKKMQENEDHKGHNGVLKEMISMVWFFSEEKNASEMFPVEEKRFFAPFIEREYATPAFNFFRPPMA